jgi:large subunit ribosomal protein L10e
MAKLTWHCYAKNIHKKPYIKKRGTRGKEYIHGGADPKIRIFEMGDLSGLIQFDVKIGVQMMNTRCVSDGTLESARMSINRTLREDVGKTGFRLKIRSHPLRVYRHNAMMAFAGADRLQQGMRQSFGKPVGRFALVNAGQIVLECSTMMKYLEVVRNACRVAGNKFPRHCRLVLLEAKNDEIKNQVGLPGPLDA